MRGKQYIDKLSPKSAAKGIKLANENAKSLILDAEILYKNNRFERTFALSVLAIEELGKSGIIRGILLTDDLKELKKEWRSYRMHTEKNRFWIVPELVAEGARTFNDLRPMVDPKSNHPQTLDHLKQLAFYTDVFSSAKWSTPSKAIDKEMAKSILNVARVMSNKNSDIIDSEEMLELWVKHLKPVWKNETSKMKQALVNCYKEGVSLKLISKEDAETMIEFLK